MNKKIVLVILIIAWMVLVFMFSSQPRAESAELSGGITNRIVNFIYSTNKTKLNKDNIDHIVRKTAHFTIYFVGGILIFLLINEYRIKLYVKILFSECFGMFYAMTDEIHQTFVSGRSGQISDVLLDSSGVLTGILLTVLLISIIRKKKLSII